MTGHGEPLPAGPDPKTWGRRRGLGTSSSLGPVGTPAHLDAEPGDGSAPDSIVAADDNPALIWVAGPDQACTWCNRTWLAFTGRTLEQERGQGWTEGLHPDDRDACLTTRRRCFEQRAAFQVEYRLRRADGEYVWMLERARPRLDADGELLGFVGACVDVTEARTLRAELMARAEQRSALADLGRAALEGADFATLARRAGDIVVRALAVDYAAVYERVEEDVLVLRASLGFPAGLIGRQIAVDVSTPVGTTVLQRTPVVVPDWDTETRFRRGTAQRHGIAAGCSVPLRRPGGTVGALAVYSATPRAFTQDDVNFLRNIANVVGAALVRDRIQADREALLDLERELRSEVEETVARLDALLEHSPVAFAFFDNEFRYVSVNQPLADIDGVAVADHIGRTLEELFPRLWEQAESPLRGVLEDGRPVVDLEVAGQTAAESGIERFFLLSVYPVSSLSGQSVGIGAVIVDITERKRAELTASLVGRSFELLANATDVDSALQDAVQLVIPSFADSCHLYYRPEGQVERVAIAHVDPELRARLYDANVRWPLDLDAALPRRSDGRRRGTRLMESVTREMRAALAGNDAEHQAVIEDHGVTSAILVPLEVGGAPIGLVVFNYTKVSNRQYRADDVALAEALAYRFTEAVDTARLRAAARRAQSRVDLLARAGELVTVELDPEARMERFVGLAVPDFSHLCAVSVIEPDGSFRVAHVAVADPALHDRGDLADAWKTLTPVVASPSTEAVRTGEPVLIPEVSTSFFAGLSPERQDLARQVGLRSLLCVPLVVEGGQILGTVTFATAGPDRRYSEEDVPLAVELGRRGAAAFRHAVNYERERAAAESLQRSLLPERLPALSTVTLTARYLPATEGMRVGGDWYDVVPLEDGRLVLAIGDVVGHGLAAASSTGRLRAALELTALDGLSPAAILERLNRYLFTVQDGDMATVLVVLYHPSDGEVQLASAGHPPVLIAERGGGARFLPHEPGPPLRASERATYRERVEHLVPGETLVLFTDGLIERRGESIDVGLERLRAAAACGPRDLDPLADHLLDDLLPGRQPGDDVAILALRGVTAGDGLHLDLPAWPRELAGLRRAARVWLGGIGVIGATADEIVVAVNEAAANTIDHAYGLRDAQFAVRASREGDLVVFEVSDHGNWRAGHDTPDRGRGLDLIRSLMTTVDLEVRSTGTTVRLARQVSPPVVEPV